MSLPPVDACPFGDRVEAAFEQACDLGDGRWEESLAGLAEADRRAALRLLRADATGARLLDRGLAGLGRLRFEAIDPMIGTVVDGRYRLGDRLGEGGMAVVYRAESLRGLGSDLALKAMRVGGLEAHQARFEKECAILGALDHPGIVRMLDAGTLRDGRPYLVMRYVEGERIDEDCRRRDLGPRAIVRLVLELCEAVEHAHARLVLHQDLKPSNILVDGEHRVHLLDFGIARLVESSDATGTEERFVTPGYSSPERVRGEPATTATDVFGLGVLLFELLSGGRHPYRREGRPKGELLRAVCAAPPPRLSLAVEEPLRARQLKGDLEAIVQKAMRPDPGDRYPGVAALRADLQSYLELRPVSAGRGRWTYALALGVRRNRAWLSVAVLGLVAVTVAVHALWQARREAETSRRAAEESFEVLVETLQGLDPAQALGPLQAEELLRLALERLRYSSAFDSAARARGLVAVGRILRNLGHVSDAERAFGAALEIGREDIETRREALLYRADLRLSLGREEEARGDLARVARSSAISPPSLSTRMRQVRLEASMLEGAGRRGEAREHLERFRPRAGALEPGDAALLAGHLARLSDPEGADPVEKTRRALRLVEDALGSGSMAALGHRRDHALALLWAGRYGEAEVELQRVLEGRSALLGVEDPSVGSALHDLGELKGAAGDYPGAVEAFRAALERLTPRLGLVSPYTVESRLSLAHHLLWTGQTEESVEVACPATVDGRRGAGLAVVCGYALLLSGDPEAARERVESALRTVEGASTSQALALALEARGVLVRAALAARERDRVPELLRLEPGEKEVAAKLARLPSAWLGGQAEWALESGKHEVARQLLEGAIREGGPFDAGRLWVELGLASLDLRDGRFLEAERRAAATGERAEEGLGLGSPTARQARALVHLARVRFAPGTPSLPWPHSALEPLRGLPTALGCPPLLGSIACSFLEADA